MKTKHILTAMVLPAMLAACTADEIVENNNVNLDGVAKLNPITFTVGEGADSRLLWDESGVGNWKWGAEGDQFSAFLVNTGVTNGVQDAVNDKLLTNYVYSSEDGVNYTTTSVMTEGTYWFFAPGSQDKKDNALISFKLPTAQGPEYYKSDDAQLFFTPLYQLAKEDAPENMNLELTSWYGRAVMPIVNGTDEAFTINQIILTLNGENWVVEGTISTKALADNGLAYAFVDGVKTPVRNLDNVATNNETLAELKARLQKANIVSTGAKTSPTLVLDLGKGVKLASGASKTFTMLVPATGEDVTCDVKLITDKGLVEIESYDDSNYTQEGVQFKHNGIMPMFGLKNANSTEFKSYKVEEGDLEDFGASYYVTTYEYMMDLINTVNGTLKVYNIGDWAIDAKMAKAITNSDAQVTFVQPIEIADENNKVELTKVYFDEEVTVVEGTEVAFGKNTYTNEKLNIEAGAKVTVNALGSRTISGVSTNNAIASVNNAGELVINDGANVSNVETSGKLTIVKDGTSTTDVTITAGELNYTAVANKTATYKASDLNIARASKKNVTITIGANVTFNVDEAVTADIEVVSSTLYYQTAIVNNGTISLSEDLTIEGDLENNKTISAAASQALHVYGTMTNALNASVAADMGVHEGASVENNGILTQVYNSGTITAGTQSVTQIKGIQDVAKGVVDNSNKALVTLASDDVNTVKYVFNGACDSEDLMELDTKKYVINKLEFKGQVTLDEAWDSTKLPLYGVDVLEFATGSSLYVNLPTTAALPINVDQIIISANVSWYGFSGYAKINLTKNTEIHVCKNMNLTWSESVEVTGGTVSYTTESVTGTDVAGKVNGTVISTIIATTHP